MQSSIFAIAALLTGAHAIAFARPALLARRGACRCASPCAQLNDGEAYVDFGEDGDECVITNSGSTCMNMASDVEGPIRIDDAQRDGLDAPGISPEYGRRSPGAGKSPGMVPFSFVSPSVDKKWLNQPLRGEPSEAIFKPADEPAENAPSAFERPTADTSFQADGLDAKPNYGNPPAGGRKSPGMVPFSFESPSVDKKWLNNNQQPSEVSGTRASDFSGTVNVPSSFQPPVAASKPFERARAQAARRAPGGMVPFTMSPHGSSNLDVWPGPIIVPDADDDAQP